MKGRRLKAGITFLNIRSAIYNSSQLCPSHGCSAHHAGFDGDVEGAIFQVFVIKIIGRSSNGNDFCMSCNVMQSLNLVVSLPNNLLEYSIVGLVPLALALSSME